jgi:hypothetical protein
VEAAKKDPTFEGPPTYERAETAIAAAAAAVGNQSRKRSIDEIDDTTEQQMLTCASSSSDTAPITFVSTPELSVDEAKIVCNQYMKDALNRKDCAYSARDLDEIAPALLYELMRYLKMKILKEYSRLVNKNVKRKVLH